ncbi:MAG: FHA domain-containing protein, partial [Anaerolineae bacterium]|nr:FHA domain-containing protein [Anaerolineae bacterium]
MPTLKMLRGPEPGRKIQLEAQELTIGRGRTNDIIIQDNEVSRVHCRLVRVLDDYEIHDLTSTNGTYVNGQKVEARGWLLSAQAIVELGDSITFEYEPSELSTSTRPPVEAKPREKPYIIIKQASLPQPEIYRLERPSISIGRDVDNDIILQEPEVSRHHLRLIQAKDGYAIEDLNTMNGTWVNDHRLHDQQMLDAADMVRIGTRVRMWYTDDPDRLLESLKSGSQILHVPVDETRQSRKPEDEKRKTSSVPAIEQQPTALLATGELELAVFLAYEWDDWGPITENLVKYLSTQNVPVWVDRDLNPNSKAWQDSIEQAQLICPIMLVVISSKALETPHIQRGIRHFVAREKPILLLQVENVEQTPM